MTIAQRLYILVLAAVLGLVGLSGLGYFQIGKVYTAANYANVNTVPSMLVLNNAEAAQAQKTGTDLAVHYG